MFVEYMASNHKDINASSRKKDHIGLAFDSNVAADKRDTRFFYEPAINDMNDHANGIGLHFLGANMEAPIWVSSMTGGTAMASHINQNLAKACHEFGLGMGLGSCRQLLDSDEYLKDFDVRETIGIQPLYANLGIAQVIDLVRKEQYNKLANLVQKLRADGLFIHINPMQEWIQPEGDIIDMNPITCIQKVIDNVDTKIMVKEVGQGFGPQSLRALLDLDIAGIELAGFGGTNFARLETLRREKPYHAELINVGHTAEEMVDFLNEWSSIDNKYLNKNIIISGGISDYLTGYYLNQKCSFPSVYGQASSFLKMATGDYKKLANYVEEQIKGYKIASQYLRIAE